MDLKKIEEFILLAKKNDVQELKYESAGEKLSVSLASKQLVETYIPREQAVESKALHSRSEANNTKPQHNFLEVTSPFVGTFYRSTSPEAPPYVKKGDKVSKGDPLCIVEAMKIMNEIESEFEGEIVEICVENENYVEYGQTLFLIKPH